MDRLKMLIWMAAAIGLAYGTAGWDSSEGVFLPELETDWWSQSAVAEAPEGPSEGGEPEAEPQPEPEPEKKPEPPKIVLRTVTDVTLCIADNGKPVDFKRSCHIHIGEEGELSWHAGGKVLELKSRKHLVSALEGRYRVMDVVWVAHRNATWQQIRDVTIATQNADRLSHFWLGVAKADEPDKLLYLPFNQVANPEKELPAGDVFTVHVREKDGGPYWEVNGVPIKEFPADLAVAWYEWRRAHMEAEVSDPEDTVVILDAHRFTPCEMVIAVIDVLRGLGVGSERLAGGLGGRKRK